MTAAVPDRLRPARNLALGCAAGLATIDVIQSEKLVERSAKLGETLAGRLDEMKQKYPFIGDRRGLGLMQATEFVKPGTREPDGAIRDRITMDAFEHGLILLPCGESTLRYIPALNIPEEILDQGLDVLDAACRRAAG